tara:strand:+ start:5942 stop:6400 length:459 start_codon:yes stop_codon:yes gene_type:complete
MLKLDNDCIGKVYKVYLEKYVICKKYDYDLKKFYFCKKVYNICKKIKFIKDCHIINISNINLQLCSIHDNVDISYIKNLLNCIETYKKRNDNKIINNNSINISSTLLDTHSYIHLFGLKQNEDLTNKVLKKYNLKIKRYCCGGNGCMLVDIN